MHLPPVLSNHCRLLYRRSTMQRRNSHSKTSHSSITKHRLAPMLAVTHRLCSRRRSLSTLMLSRTTVSRPRTRTLRRNPKSNHRVKRFLTLPTRQPCRPLTRCRNGVRTNISNSSCTSRSRRPSSKSKSRVRTFLRQPHHPRSHRRRFPSSPLRSLRRSPRRLQPPAPGISSTSSQRQRLE